MRTTSSSLSGLLLLPLVLQGVDPPHVLLAHRGQRCSAGRVSYCTYCSSDSQHQQRRAGRDQAELLAQRGGYPSRFASGGASLGPASSVPRGGAQAATLGSVRSQDLHRLLLCLPARDAVGYLCRAVSAGEAARQEEPAGKGLRQGRIDLSDSAGFPRRRDRNDQAGRPKDATTSASFQLARLKYRPPLVAARFLQEGVVWSPQRPKRRRPGASSGPARHGRSSRMPSVKIR